MSVQVVKHGSRGVEITLNFASTENNLSWAFTQEGDGEIYDVSLTNVASYTVSGASIALPYVVANSIIYTISIVKTTVGQTASITLKTRRAINKTNIVSVPDFGRYDGRYIYAISAVSNCVLKLDSRLLTISNYAGAGTWTINPVLSIITLPTLPTGGVWNRVHLRNTGNILILGTVVPNSDLYGCLIDSNDIVWDMLKITQNSYSLIASNSLGGSSAIISSVYDYINDIIAFKAHSSTSYYCKLSDNIPNRYHFNGHMSAINSAYNSANKQFIGYCGYSIDTDSFCGFYYSNSLNTPNAVIRDYGYIVKMQNNSYKWLTIWNNSGNYIGYINGTGGATSASYFSINSDQVRRLIVTFPNINSYCCLDPTPGSQFGKAFNIANFATDSVGYTCTCCSPDTGHHFAIGKGANGKKRMHVLDVTNFRNADPEVGFIDLAYDIDYIATNHIL